MPASSRSVAGCWLAAIMLAWICWQFLALQAAPVPIANPSFELPLTNYVNTNIDLWQKSPKPVSYVENGGFLWSQLTGVFANTAPGEDDYIDNLDASQAVYLFAVPEVGLFQDLSTVFEVGKAFDFTAGVIGGGGGMADHVTLELRLYYRNAAHEMVTIAATSVEQSVSAFPSTNHFVEIHVHLSGVKPADAWAGQSIGVQFFSTVDPDLQGGYWDIDNARLFSTVVPEASAGVRAALGVFVLSLRRPAHRLNPRKGNARAQAFTLLEMERRLPWGSSLAICAIRAFFFVPAAISPRMPKMN